MDYNKLKITKMDQGEQITVIKSIIVYKKRLH